jgi:hypothetical protein
MFFSGSQNAIKIKCISRCNVSFSNEEPEELIRYAALIHNSVMTATSTEQCETSCLVNDAFEQRRGSFRT